MLTSEAARLGTFHEWGRWRKANGVAAVAKANDALRFYSVDAEKRVAKQRLLVDELERDGYPATEAHEMLQVMVDLLDQIRTHADEIAKDIRH